jgi:Tol biopolymer transport system component
VAVALLSAAAFPAWAQFGKNKITYETFDWKVYAAPHFDVHYYPAEEQFLEEVVSYAESAYLHISKILDHELKFRVPLVIYKTHGEFLSTNITLAELPEGVAAFAEPVQYRMVLPIDGPPDKLYALIAHELTHIFEYSMFFEGYLGRALRSAPPLWLMEGLASYLGQDEDSIDQMVIRDAVVNNIMPPVQALNVLSFLTYRYGHAIFDFIAEEHGEEGLRTFLFEFKKVLLTGNLGKAIKESFGYDIDEFNRRFNRYLRKKYFPVLLEKKSPDDYGMQLKFKNVGFTASPSLSPSGQLVAALAAPKMELDLVVMSAETGDLVKNLTKGWTNKYKNLVAEVFSGRRDLSWSPTEDRVAIFARKENKWPLLVFDALKGKMIHEIILPEIYECASPAFSPDGRRIAFEGNRNGIVDLFEYNLDTGEIRNLTQDDFFDANPWYAADGRSMLYNRRIGSYWKIFSVDLSDPTRKTQLTIGPHSDIQPSYSRDGSKIYFSSDRGEYGVFNIHSLDLETGDWRQYTDVVGGCFEPTEMAPRGDEEFLLFTAFFEGGFKLYRMALAEPELEIAAADRLATPVEAEPFEPALQLDVDENKKSKYKLKWDVEAPSIAVGVTDDGTFLTNVGVGFTDLMGNHRIQILGASVSDFTQWNISYFNLKRRYNWGATFFDERDYFVDSFTGQRLRREYKNTGVVGFLEYPLSRYYRVQTSLGAQDTSYNQPFFDVNGNIVFRSTDNTYVFVSAKLIGDTTRYQSFGPFQGKRFSIGATYAPSVAGDFDGEQIVYSLDYRAYKQLTRRSVLAWRLAAIINDGDLENTYGFGGLNQLRGWEFREFVGSNLAWSNLELRFPLVDELRTPVLAINQIRGFFFLDVGAPWFGNGDLFYDPEFGIIRVDFSTVPNVPIPFKFWDSDENRLQDGRASYGVGFQFFFIGGLQFNWIWAKRLDYTQFTYFDADGNFMPTPIPVKADTGGTISEFYIAFDW